MAVSLSSDLILDVMRNADPARLKTATAKLETLDRPDDSSRAFANTLGGIQGEVDALSQGGMGGMTQISRAQGGKPQSPYQDFERMVLRNLFESLLPSAQSGAFGTDSSAGIWRSLAADQFAGVYASSGGIGIASTLSATEGVKATQAETQWPYFRTDKIEAFTG